MIIEKRARQVNSALKEWYELTGKTETTPNEIMPYLIEQGIYRNDGRDDALQLRNDLRKLHYIDKLHLIEGSYYEQKDKNKNWRFRKIIK